MKNTVITLVFVAILLFPQNSLFSSTKTYSFKHLVTPLCIGGMSHFLKPGAPASHSIVAGICLVPIGIKYLKKGYLFTTAAESVMGIAAISLLNNSNNYVPVARNAKLGLLVYTALVLCDNERRKKFENYVNNNTGKIGIGLIVSYIGLSCLLDYRSFNTSWSEKAAISMGITAGLLWCLSKKKNNFCGGDSTVICNDTSTVTINGMSYGSNRSNTVFFGSSKTKKAKKSLFSGLSICSTGDNNLIFANNVTVKGDNNTCYISNMTIKGKGNTVVNNCAQKKLFTGVNGTYNFFNSENKKTIELNCDNCIFTLYREGLVKGYNNTVKVFCICSKDDSGACDNTNIGHTLNSSGPAGNPSYASLGSSSTNISAPAYPPLYG